MTVWQLWQLAVLPPFKGMPATHTLTWVAMLCVGQMKLFALDWTVSAEEHEEPRVLSKLPLVLTALQLASDEASVTGMPATQPRSVEGHWMPGLMQVHCAGRGW